MTQRTICDKFTLEKRIILSSMSARCLTTLVIDLPKAARKFSREAMVKSLQDELRYYEDPMRVSKCLYASNPFVTECIARQNDEQRTTWHRRAYGADNGRLHVKVDVDRIYLTQGAPKLEGEFAKAVHKFVAFQGSDAAERHRNE